MSPHLVTEMERVQSDAEFDLVVGEVEMDIPEHGATSMASPQVPETCQAIYCC
jgi:hypothetical protein